MRITTKGRYALRAMANLALSSKDKPKSIRVIAEEEDISPEFLEQIFFKLKKANIIQSVRGPGGGFRLHHNPEEITVRDIFLAVDEGLDLTPCTSCNEKNGETCPRTDSCIVHDIWKDASMQINGYFDGINLRAIMDSPKGQNLGAIVSSRELK